MGFQFTPTQIVVTEAIQGEKLGHSGLNSDELKGYVDEAKRISVQRALALGSEPCLERIDLDLALLETPSLSGGVERRPREIDDWGQDDDDDWVVP